VIRVTGQAICFTASEGLAYKCPLEAPLELLPTFQLKGLIEEVIRVVRVTGQGKDDEKWVLFCFSPLQRPLDLATTFPTKSGHISKIEKDFQDLPGPDFVAEKKDFQDFRSSVSREQSKLACFAEMQERRRSQDFCRLRQGGKKRPLPRKTIWKCEDIAKKRSVAGTLLSGVVEPRGLSLWFGRAGQME